MITMLYILFKIYWRSSEKDQVVIILGDGLAPKERQYMNQGWRRSIMTPCSVTKKRVKAKNKLGLANIVSRQRLEL